MTGMTRADFLSNGILPLLIEIWKRWARPGVNSFLSAISQGYYQVRLLCGV